MPLRTRRYIKTFVGGVAWKIQADGMGETAKAVIITNVRRPHARCTTNIYEFKNHCLFFAPCARATIPKQKRGVPHHEFLISLHGVRLRGMGIAPAGGIKGCPFDARISVTCGPSVEKNE